MHSFSHSSMNQNLSKLYAIVLMALLYYLAGNASFSVAEPNAIVTIVIFAAEGFALAGVLIFGRSILPGIFLGQLWLALEHNLGLIPALGVSAVNTLEGLLAWYLFRFFNLDITLQKVTDILGLFLLIALILQPFSALSGTSILYASSVIPESEFARTLFSWWFGNMMGQMLWTPMLLLYYTRKEEMLLPTLLSTLFFFSLIAYTLFFILPIDNISFLIILSLPAATFLAVRYGAVYGAIAIVILSFFAMTAAYKHIGIFANAPMLNTIIDLNFYILLHILVVLTIATLYQNVLISKEALYELNRTLESRVKRQVDELNKQNIIMAQQARLASMGEMLGMIAHQWKQPLNSINSNVAVLHLLTQRHLPDNTLFNQKLANITKQTQFMSDTIEDFSSFFHPDKHAVKFHPKETLKRALKLIEIENKQIDVTIEMKTDTSPIVYAYENEYLQVILTILHNAIENFTAKKIEEPALYISLDSTEKEVSLSILDNGGGIVSKDINAIFDPYFTTNHSGKNSGLGLYMAKLLIEESMGGSLSVTNREGGACFKITLPKEGEDHAS